MFTASFAVFFQNQFFLIFQFVFGGNVVLALACLTDEGKQHSLFLFSHMGDYILASDRKQ